MASPMYGPPVGYPPPGPSPLGPMYGPPPPARKSNKVLIVLIVVGLVLAIIYYNMPTTGSPAASVPADPSPTPPPASTTQPPPAATPPPAPAPAPTPSAPAPTCADPYAYYYYYAPDVQAANINGFTHWITSGYKEGRKSCWPAPRQHTDRLTSDGVGGYTNLLEGESIYSSNKMYFLTLQTDGNLVLYTVATGKAKWAAGTYNKGTVGSRQLVMQGDGNTVLYNVNQAIWNTGKNSTDAPFSFVIQNDGNGVVYGRSGRVLWDCC